MRGPNICHSMTDLKDVADLEDALNKIMKRHHHQTARVSIGEWSLKSSKGHDSVTLLDVSIKAHATWPATDD